uniref:GRB2 associated binding protein 2 n=1 Tax=Naja naja TaxID=35670 RepID=A0A8C6XFK8_NAJNA
AAGGGVVCSGWLRKSPPEKKLRRYVSPRGSRLGMRAVGVRSGWLCVCAIHCINKHLGKLKKNVQIKLIFKKIDNKVILSLSLRKVQTQINCHLVLFTTIATSLLLLFSSWADSLRNVPLVSHGPRSSPAEFSGSNQRLLRERKTSAPSHSSQPTLFTFESPSNHIRSTLSTSAPQDYLFLHQCMSQKSENTRSASFSQATRFFMRSDPSVQKLSQENGHCVNGLGGQLHGFYSLPKPNRHNSELRDSAYDLPRSFGCYAHTKSSLTGSETSDSEEVYTFKTPNSTLCKDFGELPADSYDVPGTPLSIYQIPRTFTLDKNHNALAVAASGDMVAMPPPRPPKPGQAESRWGSPQQRLMDSEGLSISPVVTTIPRRNTLPAVENCRLHRGSSITGGPILALRKACFSASRGCKGFLPGGLKTNKTVVARSHSADSEDNYVPMNPGSSHLQNTERSNDSSSQHLYIPMSPGPHHLDRVAHSSTTFPAQKGSGGSSQPLRRMSEIQPPPINRNLKPDRKAKPTPLDLRGNSVIDELPFKSPVTKSWSRPGQTFNSNFSQYCRPTSTQSITSTDSGDSEENYVAMQNPVSASPIPSGKSSPAQKKSSTSVDYLALDFQPSSPGPHRKPSTSSVASDEKVDYVQVDKEKTQALQSTMQEWTDVRQSSEPSKTVKQ